MGKQLTHGSLFSGIGGFDLAAEWMGWGNIFHCEWNEFGQKVLKHYWPKAISYADITKTDFSIHRGSIDVLTGGFPCQPYSSAGKRLGKEDERHLWPEMLRAIREIQPTWVVGENVRGLLNWNGGLVFHDVQTELESEGYEVLPFLLPAAGVNAPHERYRIWFIAYANGSSPGYSNTGTGSQKESQIWRGAERDVSKPFCSYGVITNPDGQQRCERRMHPAESETAKRYAGPLHARGHERSSWNKFPTQPPLCNGNDGFPAELDGITLSKWRNESIKAGGNAIVPQVSFQIFKAIKAMHASP